MRWYETQYSDKGKFLNHPYAFPATATNFAGLAPAVIVTAEYDPLADDGEHYANLLKQAGVKVTFKEYEGAIHGFNALAGIAPEIAAEVQTFLSQVINEFLGRGK
jgi:acetyl esterase